MTTSHTFQTVSTLGISRIIATVEEPDRYGQWLVALTADRADGLYEETKAEAFGYWLQERSGPDAVHVLYGSQGETFVAINPANDAAIIMAIQVAPEVEDGLHLNTELYNLALDEAVDDHWSDLEMSRRLALMKQYRQPGESIALALRDTPPDSLRPILQERFEH